MSERILEFEFRTVVPSKELATMTLVIELIPNAPNIILLDMERRVLASFSPVTPQHEIGEYEAYATPVVGNKIGLERVRGRMGPGPRSGPAPDARRPRPERPGGPRTAGTGRRGVGQLRPSAGPS